MILQMLPANEGEGMILWIIIVTVLATMGIALLRAFVGSIVEKFLVKKDESKERATEEVRRFSIVFFIFIVGILLLVFQDSIGLFLNRPAEELAFAGLMVIIFAILVTGLTYRTGTEKVIGKIRRK